MPGDRRCILHLDEPAKSDYYNRVRGGERFTASGLHLDGPTFSAILAAIPTSSSNPSGQPRPEFPGRADFRETTFEDYVDAQHVIFSRDCSFAKARFESGFIWNGSRFGGRVDFTYARTRGNADFSNCTVAGDLNLIGLKCPGIIQLVQADIGGDVDLRLAEAGGIWLSFTRISGKLDGSDSHLGLEGTDAASFAPRMARIDGCEVRADCLFERATFPYETTFGGYADMPPAKFGGRFSLAGATLGSPQEGGRHLLRSLDFEHEVDLSRLRIYGRISLAKSTFARLVKITDWEISAGSAERANEVDPRDTNAGLFSLEALDLSDTEFRAGVEIDSVSVDGEAVLRFTERTTSVDILGFQATEQVRVRSTTFNAYLPITVSSGTEIVFDRCQFMRGGVATCIAPDVRIESCDARQPMIFLTPPEADVRSGLTSLKESNVENIVLQDIDITKARFVSVANLDKLRLEGSSWDLAQRTGGPRRLRIDDESLVRGKSASDRRGLADPRRVAAVYRALRKNREDSKDEPGGADFYYGEMEMRRIGASWRSSEKYLLTGYWLISGYGLRAIRALIGVLIVLTVCTIGLAAWGGVPRTDSMDFAGVAVLVAQISVGLDRPPDGLSAKAGAVLLLARIAIPTLLALAALAVRGRVKR